MSAPDELDLTRYSGLITAALAGFRGDSGYAIDVARDAGRIVARRERAAAKRQAVEEEERRVRTLSLLGYTMGD
jgi:hypothetical protein